MSVFPCNPCLSVVGHIPCKVSSPQGVLSSAGSVVLQLLGVVGLNGLRLDDDSGVTAGEGSALGGDGAGDIA